MTDSFLLMTFPKDEWTDIKARLSEGKVVHTIRVSQECGKFHEGDIVETPWGSQVKILSVKKITGGIAELAKTYAYFNKLSKEVIQALSLYEEMEIITFVTACMEQKEEKRQNLVVIAAIRDAEGRILLQKRLDPLIPDAHGKWEFPGGKIHFGERPEEALCREVREEIGCEILPLRLLPSIQSSIWSRTDGEIQQVFIVCFEATLVSGIPQPLDKKVGEVRWYEKQDVASLDTLKGIKDFIELWNI